MFPFTWNWRRRRRIWTGRERRKGIYLGRRPSWSKGREVGDRAPSRSTYFGALRAQWDYNTDWSDQRDVDKDKILVLILFTPLVSDGKSRPSKAVSQEFCGRM